MFLGVGVGDMQAELYWFGITNLPCRQTSDLSAAEKYSSGDFLF